MNIALNSFRASAALVTSGLLVVLGATAAGAAPGRPAETAQDRGVVTGPAPVCKANPCRSKEPVIRPKLNRDTVRSQDWVRDAWSWEIIAPDAGCRMPGRWAFERPGVRLMQRTAGSGSIT
ncbi:hypothetical protein [Kocuria sp. ZOR0020]|uniref:hypothetical protein n=1 Tax=Kocuria sp. ZOR0020 TaxID=1339234 RepID=UPI0006483BCF|nr:hypothetical protein [Kocuria sp. ZOR0020]